MSIEVVFETHSWSEDNDKGLATGWLPGALSERGRGLAAELGERRRHDHVAAVFCSDLNRARETADIAFAGADVPVFLDWRLRECNYGTLNGTRAHDLHVERHRYLTEPYPGGESWEQAIDRVRGFLNDLPTYWSDKRVLVIGHVATRWALAIAIGGEDLAKLNSDGFDWREGWEYRLEAS